MSQYPSIIHIIVSARGQIKFHKADKFVVKEF